jgi:hypothetical protein
MIHTNEQYCREHKASVIFEGENSSLRKTYEEATKPQANVGENELEKFKFWLFELDETELCNARNIIIKTFRSLISTTSAQKLESLEREIGELPTICGICERSGVNIYGECKCSYKANKFVTLTAVLDIIRKQK